MIVLRDEQTLEIRQIFEGVIAASKGVQVFDELFAHCSPAELYPPKSYIDLMAVLPHPGVTMTVKLKIMGYFAKDLDASTEKAVDRKYFKEACGYLFNDEMTDAAMSEMQAAWSSDQGLLREHCGCGRLGTDEQKRWRETEEKLNTQAARESNPRPTEHMARQSCELHQEVPHGQAAQTQTDEPIFVEPVQSEDAELPNQPVRIRDRRAEAFVCKRCPICSIHLHGPNANGHPNAHKEDPKKSSFCAICGIIMQKSSGRNVHEHNQHGFIRHEADEKIKEVVRIRKSQLPRLFNVGTKLVDVQRTAVPSSNPHADEFATDNELQEVVHADPQGDGCPDPKKNDVRKTAR
ncbi:hypothetical protein M3Y99_01303500 [Aphelenchoides fujianensis]|nr:hypothetical protein M3Y99_01303500 [Aphelenchoides fujianensis]